MITLDGSQGEGGGQILRSALALSVCTGAPLHLVNIRAKRQKPGLMRQHLTAVQAAAAICGGRVEGAAVGAREIRFRPGKVRAGDYAFAIGTAGSTTLVFQTVLPPLMMAAGRSTVLLEGGTHNPMAPPFEFIEQAFLPLIARMGVKVAATLERHGFYPAGGGRWRAVIEPASRLQPLVINERGAILEHSAEAVCGGIAGDVAQRELDTVAGLLNWEAGCLRQRSLPPGMGPGNYLRLTVRSQHIGEVFMEVGERGVSAENVASRAARRVRRYLASETAVAEHLADQLLLPLALVGSGEFTTLAPTPHTMTNIEVIQRFLPVRIDVERTGKDQHRITVQGSGADERRRY